MAHPRSLGALAVTAFLAAWILHVAPAWASEETAEGGVGVRLVDAPAALREDPRARFYVIDHVSPGAAIERRIGVSNTTDELQHIEVYAGPAQIVDGNFAGGAAGEESELTQWTSLSDSTVAVPPDREQMVTVTIDVPEDASEGERYGVIWASVASEGDGNVQMVNRVGIRIYLSVGPGGEPASDFEVSTLTAARTDAGQPVVQAKVENTGGRAIDISGELTLSDGPGSLSAGPFPAELGTTLAPGDTAPVSVVLNETLPDGPWHATLTLKSGLLEETVEADVTFPEAGETAAPVAVEGPWWQQWPMLAGLGGAVLLVLGAALTARRRSRANASEKEPVPVG